MSGVHTESAFEASIEAGLLEGGWARGETSSYSVKLGLDATELAAFVEASQPDEWEQLTIRLGGRDAAAERVAAQVARQLDARGTVDVLRTGLKMNGVAFRVAFFAPANGLVPELWRRYRANRLSVVRQLHHSESNLADSLDLVLLVNGIPTATAELKNPLTGQTVGHAMAQYRRDRNPADLIFRARAVVHFAVDPELVFMTTRLAGAATRFLPFDQGSGGPGAKGGAGNPANPDGYATAYLWEQVWQRDAWLDLLGTFVHIEDVRGPDGKKTGEKRTLFPRFHQWHAVRSLLAATVAAGPGVNRLVEHSAGSGKSNTIAWAAHHLSRLHTPHRDADLTEAVRAAGLSTDQPMFAKVVIITDRRVLDRQLQETVAGFEHTPGTIVTVDKDSAQLREALAGNAARIVVTTLQKFPVVAEYAAQAAKAAAADGDQVGGVAGVRFAVIIDEAHSSTSGEAMKDLKRVLGAANHVIDDSHADPLGAAEAAEAAVEDAAQDATDVIAASMAARGASKNLSLFAFTATPKPKTLELFGEPGADEAGGKVFRAFHLYSMRQAIEEGFILDVLANYTTYATYYRLANSGGDPERTVPKGKAAAALARFVSLHPTNLSQKAEIIVEHFRQHTAGKIGGRAKAMVVTRSRLHAVRYKQAIDAYIKVHHYDRGPGKLAALVAFSGTVSDPGAPAVVWTEAGMNGFSESKLPARFASDEYQVLIVAEKYQTGFDQPLLHTMYVDKKLAGVKAVQTLSRLNRVHPGKTDTFVLDFANTADEIQEAFRPFYEATFAEATDPNVLYDLERRIRATRIIDPAEQEAAVIALLSGQKARQKDMYANLYPARDRFAALLAADALAGAEGGEADKFREALSRFVRAYAFLAQIMPWTDRDLESLYLYGKALLAVLPKTASETMPDLTDSVILTHLRTEAVENEADLSLAEGTEAPGVALPGEGRGPQHDEPRDSLTALIEALNQRFGMNLTDADRVWFEQQIIDAKNDDELRVIALNNDRDQYQVASDQRAEDRLVERHQSNGELFSAFYARPGFRDALLKLIADETYRYFRDEGEAS